MPDRPDNPINNAPTGATPGRAQRVNYSPTHHHLDTDALSAYIDNRLEGDLALTAAGHIEACSDCRRELAELRATVSLLIGLPQYRPHRTFALGPEYAHPIRTSLFARFLPLLPRLQAATVACLLLLLVIGAGDVLTQIGDDSDSGAPRSSEPEQTGGDTAFESGGGSGGVERPDAGANVGDGTGGESGGAGFANDSESKPGTDTGNASQSDELAPNAAAPPADDAPVEEFSESPPTEDSDADSANESQSISAAPAPDTADSAADSDEDESAADEENLGEAPAGAADADAVDSASAGGNDAPRESAAEGAAAPEPADATSGGSSNDGQVSTALPRPTAASDDSEPVPTIGITTEEPGDAAAGDVAQADASGSATPARQSGSASDSGISNWRLIEIVLGIVLVVLAVLVVVLHRLNSRARKIGIIR